MRVFSALLVALVAFSLSALSWFSRHLAPAPPPVSTIGVELPLAGVDGGMGLAAANAVQLALDESQRPGLKALRVAASIRDGTHHGFANPHQDEGVDDTGEPKAAAAIVDDFARAQSAVALVGGLAPTVAASLARESERTHLPLLALAPLPLRCSGSYRQMQYAASLAGNAARESAAVIAFARGSLHAKRLAIVDDGEFERRRVADCISVLLLRRQRDGEMRIGFIRNERAYRRALGAIAAYHADALAFVAPATRGTLLCPARATPFVLAPGYLAAVAHRSFDSTTLPRGCGWVRRTVHAHDRAAYAAFTAHYRQRFGARPPPEAGLAYAATQVAVAAIHSANGGTAPLRDKVERALRDRRFATILGPLGLDAHGEPDHVWFAYEPHRRGRFFNHREAAIPALR